MGWIFERVKWPGNWRTTLLKVTSRFIVLAMFKQAQKAILIIIIGSAAQRGFSNYASKSFIYIHWVQQLFESKSHVMTLLVGGI